MRNRIKLLAMTLVAGGALVLLMVGLFLPTQTSAQDVTVSVNAPATVAPGDYFWVNVDISPVTAFDAGDFRVLFDSGVLAIDDITPGSDVTNGLIGGTTIPVAGTSQISADVVKVLVNVTGTPGVTGSGYLCRIRFHAIGTSGTSSTITLTNGMLGNNAAAEIPASWVGDTVDVTSGGTPTPTSTPTSTPTPTPTPAAGWGGGTWLGIGISIPLVLILILGLGFWLGKRRRQSASTGI